MQSLHKKFPKIDPQCIFACYSPMGSERSSTSRDAAGREDLLWLREFS
jgi:hypothetical protein